MHWRQRSHRRRSINEPGHAHELTFTCFHRYRFLHAERTCQWFAEAIDRARAELDFALWACVFMPEHAHLLIWPRQPKCDVSAILKAIKEPVGRKAIGYLRQNAPDWISRITVRHGTRTVCRFWQAGGGYDRNVVEPATLGTMIEYLHNTPVRRGLVELPQLWKWSSAAWLQGDTPNSLRPDPIPPDWGVVEFPGRGGRG
jgi:putative transposase